MKDWKEYRLGEMIQCNPQVKLEKGKSYTLIDIDSIEIGSRYVKGKELTEYDGQSGCHFQNGDTVMARITPCLENGKIAQVQCESQKGFGSTELFVFRGTENKTDSDYVFNLMSMQFIRNLAANSMTGASGRQRADLGFIKRIKWNFPPLPTQQKIASILSAYDNLIQNYKKQIEALQTAASELYKEWFVRFRFPGWQNAKFENGIPEGWKVVLASELGEFIRGKNITAEGMQEGMIPVISAGIEPSGFHNQSNVKGVSLTISNSGANAGYLQINYSNIWAADCSYCNSAKHIYFYYELLNNMRVVLFNLQKGAAQPHVYAKDINKMKIILPPSELIETANKKIKLMHEKIYSLQQQITNLTQQRDLLLPRLMSGKLEVLK